MDLHACIESRVNGLQHMYNIIRKAMGLFLTDSHPNNHVADTRCLLVLNGCKAGRSTFIHFKL